jgi:hypothetical protein
MILDARIGHRARDLGFAGVDEVRGARLILQLQCGNVAADAPNGVIICPPSVTNVRRQSASPEERV